MAKKDDGFGASKSKMTVLLFQLEGSDQTLQHGIQKISHALSGILQSTKAQSPGLLLSGAHTAEEMTAESVVDLNTEDRSSVEDPPGNGTAPKKAPTPRSPNVLPELKVSADELRQYCDAKDVGDQDSRRYLAIAAFLKDKMNIPSVTPDHIHTCYRLLSWGTPRDAGAPLRRLKAQGLFTKGAKKGEYAINHVGENSVREMRKA
jgi:hypothetical protein